MTHYDTAILPVRLHKLRLPRKGKTIVIAHGETGGLLSRRGLDYFTSPSSLVVLADYLDALLVATAEQPTAVRWCTGVLPRLDARADAPWVVSNSVALNATPSRERPEKAD